jgi:GDPmannose 4,6-dehydratase
MKTALIWGITGQDGSYLAELLLSKGYNVIGVARRVSVPTDVRIRHLLPNEHFKVVDGDVTDAMCVYRLIVDHDPDETYNLSAQSHVKISFDEACHTWDVTAKGALNILEAIRHSTRPQAIRFYQASSSEMFGASYSLRWTERGTHSYNATTDPLEGVYTEVAFQDEATPFAPNSPYAIAKLAAHNAVRVYREAYGLHASSGILFNHESERRGENFVTRKISKYVANLPFPLEKLRLGNLEACRDWGHAEDFVKAMWLMLQQEKPDDYVVATGETHTVQDFLKAAFEVVGIHDPTPHWQQDSTLYRPCEVNFLRGDASKARKVLGWEPKIDFSSLVKRMVLSDMWAR